MRKLPGICPLCDCVAWDLAEGPGAAPYGNSRRWMLLLSSGNQAYVTTCDTCEIKVEHLPELWEACIRATEVEVRGAMTEPQERALWCMVRDLPLAVLGYETWGEVMLRG